ncbi:MAG TPA: cyclase family protein [Candidatus Angelobacter sp.]|nr:cyclase family protein [Candidatus Angelobacter sp.]
MNALLQLLKAAKVYDLAQSYFVGMPHHPSHPPFLYSLTKKHGDYLIPGGGSSASDALALGSHVGTHIDALCHFSCNGKLHGGHEVSAVQSLAGGMQKHSIECLNLEQLAAERVYEFVFVAAPLKIKGGTGSPIRPIALVS